MRGIIDTPIERPDDLGYYWCREICGCLDRNWHGAILLSSISTLNGFSSRTNHPILSMFVGHALRLYRTASLLGEGQVHREAGREYEQHTSSFLIAEELLAWPQDGSPTGRQLHGEEKGHRSMAAWLHFGRSSPTTSRNESLGKRDGSLLSPGIEPMPEPMW